MLKLLISKSGMALVYVILIVTVVAVAGVTVYSVSASDTFKAEKDESAAQAYYYAKSGVELAIGYIMEGKITFNPGTEVTYYGNLGDVFDQTADYDADGNKAYNVAFTISMINDEVKKESKFVIKSTGYVDLSGSNGYIDSSGSSSGAEASSTALAFEITKQELDQSVEGGQTIEVGEGTPAIVDGNLQCNYAVFVDKEIEMKGSPSITGPAGLNKGVFRMQGSADILGLNSNEQGLVFLGPTAGMSYPNNFDEEWEIIPFKPEVKMPGVPDMPVFPSLREYLSIPDGSGIPYAPNINGSSNISLASNSVTKYSNINVGWNDTLTFHVEDNATVIVDRYSNTGKLKITGDGVLTLIINNDISHARTLMNQDGESSQLILYATGDHLNFGYDSVIHGTIYAPNADIGTNKADITGDIIAGGNSFNFASLSHNGTLYITNENADVKYSGNRAAETGVETNIVFKGTKLDISPAHMGGDIYAFNDNAAITVSSSTTLEGNILTMGNSVTINGNAYMDGHIIASNPQMVIDLGGSVKYSGAIVTAGKSVALSGDAKVKEGIIFAPNAAVMMWGSAGLNGSITASTLYMDGSADIAYTYINYSDLPVIVQPTTDASVSTTNWRVYGTWVKE